MDELKQEYLIEFEKLRLLEEVKGDPSNWGIARERLVQQIDARARELVDLLMAGNDVDIQVYLHGGQGITPITDTMLRDRAGESGAKKLEVPEGASLTWSGLTQTVVIEGRETTWYQVSYGGKIYWVYGRLISTPFTIGEGFRDLGVEVFVPREYYLGEVKRGQFVFLDPADLTQTGVGIAIKAQSNLCADFSMAYALGIDFQTYLQELARLDVLDYGDHISDDLTMDASYVHVVLEAFGCKYQTFYEPLTDPWVGQIKVTPESLKQQLDIGRVLIRRR